MRQRSRYTPTVLGVLAPIALLWLAAILFFSRISPFLHAVLIRKSGAVLLLGTLSVCSLIALALSLRPVARERTVWLGVVPALSRSVVLPAVVTYLRRTW